VDPKVVPTFCHFLGAKLIRMETQSVSELGTRNLVNSYTNTVQMCPFECHKCDTKVTQIEQESVRKLTKRGFAESGGTVPPVHAG